MMVVRNIGSSCIEMNERVGPYCLWVCHKGSLRLDTVLTLCDEPRGNQIERDFLGLVKVLSVAIE